MMPHSGPAADGPASNYLALDVALRPKDTDEDVAFIIVSMFEKTPSKIVFTLFAVVVTK